MEEVVDAKNLGAQELPKADPHDARLMEAELDARHPAATKYLGLEDYVWNMVEANSALVKDAFEEFKVCRASATRMAEVAGAKLKVVENLFVALPPFVLVMVAAIDAAKMGATNPLWVTQGNVCGMVAENSVCSQVVQGQGSHAQDFARNTPATV